MHAMTPPALHGYRPLVYPRMPSRADVLGQVGGNPIALANSLASQAMPPPVKAAIDASPLTTAQKKQLKTQPLSVFMVMADHSQDLVIKFINRVHQLSGAPWNYTFGALRLNAKPSKSDSPILLTAKFLTVSHFHPLQAFQVAAELTFQYGLAAPLTMTGAAFAAHGKELINAAQFAAEQATNVAQQAGQTIQQAAGQVTQAVQQSVTNVLKVFGLGEAATAAGAGVTAATVTTSSVASLTGLVTASIGLAKILVPMIMQIVGGTAPQPASGADISGAAQAGAIAQNAQRQGTPAELAAALQQDAAAKDKILGVPRPIAIWGGVALGATALGIGIWAAMRPEKPKKRQRKRKR